MDDDGAFARDLRLRLMREHLDRAADGTRDDDLIDPHAAVAVMAASARAGTGRLRPHRPDRLSRLTRLWAVPAYRLVYDPDGRSYRERLSGAKIAE